MQFGGILVPKLDIMLDKIVVGVGIGIRWDLFVILGIFEPERADLINHVGLFLEANLHLVPARKASLGEVVAVAPPHLHFIAVVKLVYPVDHIGKCFRRLYCAVRMMRRLFVDLNPSHKTSLQRVIQTKGSWLRKSLCHSFEPTRRFVSFFDNG